MLDMTCIDWFINILKIDKNPVRIILTGHTLHEIVEDMNTAQIDYHLSKTEMPEKMEDMLNNASKLYHQRKSFYTRARNN